MIPIEDLRQYEYADPVTKTWVPVQFGQIEAGDIVRHLNVDNGRPGCPVDGYYVFRAMNLPNVECETIEEPPDDMGWIFGSSK